MSDIPTNLVKFSKDYSLYKKEFENYVNTLIKKYLTTNHEEILNIFQNDKRFSTKDKINLLVGNSVRINKQTFTLCEFNQNITDEQYIILMDLNNIFNTNLDD